METLRDIGVEVGSNLIWIAVVFAFVLVRDRRKRAAADRCVEAYLVGLVRSAAQARDTIQPYVYLVGLRAHRGTILLTLLERITAFCADLQSRTQEVLGLVESPGLQERILDLHRRVILFHSRAWASLIAVDLIVGNPERLVEERGDVEERDYRAFLDEYRALVHGVVDAAPERLRRRIPSEVLELLDAPGPLEAPDALPPSREASMTDALTATPSTTAKPTSTPAGPASTSRTVAELSPARRVFRRIEAEPEFLDAVLADADVALAEYALTEEERTFFRDADRRLLVGIKDSCFDLVPRTREASRP